MEEEEDRQTIFKKFASSIGGGIEINKGEDKEEQTPLNIITTDRDINDDGIVKHEHF